MENETRFKRTKAEIGIDMFCQYCGNRLDPREFELDDGAKYFAVFDNCYDLDNVGAFQTLEEAVMDFIRNSLVKDFEDTHG